MVQRLGGPTPEAPPERRPDVLGDLQTERFARLLTGLPATGEIDRVGAPRASSRMGPRALGWLLAVGGVLGLLVSTLRAAENSRLFDLVPGCGPGPVLGCEPPPATVWDPVFALVGIAGFAVAATVGVLLISAGSLPQRVWLALQVAVGVGVGTAHILVLRNLFVADAFCSYCLSALVIAIPIFWLTTSNVVRDERLAVPAPLARALRGPADYPALVIAVWYAGLAALLFLNSEWYERNPAEDGAFAAVALISTATIAGAWTANHFAERMGLWLSMASAMMMVTAMTDILPDVWHESEETGVPLWMPALALVGAFLVVTLLTRGGDGHGHGHGHAEADTGGLPPESASPRSAALGGVGAAAALTTHRVIEGATLALTPSIAVVAALLVHSASEGLALGALLQKVRTSLVTWLSISAAAPVLGLVIATISPLPEAAVPVLLALVGGVLLRTAVLGLQLAIAKRRVGELLDWHIAAAVLAAAGLGALTVLTHG